VRAPEPTEVPNGLATSFAPTEIANRNATIKATMTITWYSPKPSSIILSANFTHGSRNRHSELEKILFSKKLFLFVLIFVCFSNKSLRKKQSRK